MVSSRWLESETTVPTFPTAGKAERARQAVGGVGTGHEEHAHLSRVHRLDEGDHSVGTGILTDPGGAQREGGTEATEVLVEGGDGRFCSCTVGAAVAEAQRHDHGVVGISEGAGELGDAGRIDPRCSSGTREVRTRQTRNAGDAQLVEEGEGEVKPLPGATGTQSSALASVKE